MISYSKALTILIFTSSISARAASAHRIPKDFDMDKFRAKLEEIRADSDGGDFLEGHEYIAPGPDDDRSPCPFINIMANHGFINRNGRDINIYDIGQLAPHMYDVPSESFDGIINAAIYAGQAVNLENGETLLGLDRLWDRPGEERDASMAFPNPGMAWPDDVLTPGAVPFNTELDNDLTFQEFRRTVDEDLVENLLSKNPGSDVLKMDDMYSHFYDRIVDSRRNDPFFRWGPNSRGVAAGQYQFPIMILGESKDDFTEVPKAYVRTLLLEERLPDGYMPRSLRYPDFNVTKYIVDGVSFIGNNTVTAIRAENADLTGGPNVTPNLRGNVGVDTV